MKICKNCGEINTNDCEFCCNCGKSVFIFHEEIICPNCHSINDTSFAHCIICGKELPKTVNVDVVAPDTAQTEEGYTPVPVDLREQLSEVYGGLATSTPAEAAQCPSCGSIVPIHAIYCQKCGTAVAKLHEHRVVNRKICPHCGRPNGLEAAYCSYCFCSLANAETEEMQVVHDARPVGDDMVKQAFLEDEHGKKKICENCGALNPVDELFCVNCGLKLDAEEQRKFCPNCGTENHVDNVFCVKCQWSFDGTSPDSGEKWTCPECKSKNDSTNAYCVGCGTKRNAKGRKR